MAEKIYTVTGMSCAACVLVSIDESEVYSGLNNLIKIMILTLQLILQLKN